MKFILELCNRLFDLITFGSSLSSRYWFMAVISLISALVFLYLYKLISNQQRIIRYKNSIWGNILQMRIYQDNLRVICTSILKVLGYNLLYLKEMLLPMLVLLPALALFTIQINNRCGYKPLADGDRAAVRVALSQTAAGDVYENLQRVTLETVGGITLQTPALRAPDEGAVFWRAGARRAERESSLVVSSGSQKYSKVVAVAGVPIESGFDPVLCKWSWSEGLIHNAEGFLPADSEIESISIDYQRQEYPLLWWDTDALIVYFVLVLVFALAFKPLFRVTL